MFFGTSFPNSWGSILIMSVTIVVDGHWKLQFLSVFFKHISWVNIEFYCWFLSIGVCLQSSMPTILREHLDSWMLMLLLIDIENSNSWMCFLNALLEWVRLSIPFNWCLFFYHPCQLLQIFPLSERLECWCCY